MPGLGQAVSSNLFAFLAVLVTIAFAYGFRASIGRVAQKTAQESAALLNGYRAGPRGAGHTFALVFCLAYLWGKWALLAGLFAALLFGWLLF